MRARSFPRHLRLSDVVLIVVGSVVGSGIFRTPALVAQHLPAASLVLAAWLAGSIVALCGALVLGELGARLPKGCGPYAYLSAAFHPIVGFAYGWTGLLASFSGGIAAAAALFAGYFLALTGLPFSPAIVAAVALASLSVVNAFGLRAGNRLQGTLTVLKIVALLAIVAAGIFAHPAPASHHEAPAAMADWPGALGIAMIPILFSYNGAMVANFMAPETNDAPRTLPLGLILGMACVAILYVLVNASCVRILGIHGLAQTPVPASSVLFAWAGPLGSRIAALVVAIVTLAFISNRVLTVPRLYQAMAQDGLFFRHVARIDPRTHAPVVAIAVQGVVAMLIVLSGNYDQILNYVVATFYAFNGLLALALVVLRMRDRGRLSLRAFRVPAHPISTAIYLVASWGVAIAACVTDPRDGLIGVAILASAIPVYFLWTRRGVPAGAPS
ncbi:MAG TPA: amino acid permease [Candidatus Cybelea sp.]|nr:amino acid permease [Candidatus Cybelea sp.]